MVFNLEGIGMVRMEFDHVCSLDRIVKGTKIFKISGKILSKEFNGFLHYQFVNKTKELTISVLLKSSDQNITILLSSTLFDGQGW